MGKPTVHSDEDSDLEELRGDIARFDHSVRSFLDEQHGSRPAGAPRPRAPRRGPRKAAQPRGDIKARLARVNKAFLEGDYGQALDMVCEVIRINAETWQAWTTLGSIFREQNQNDKALMSMVYAAHLRPKVVAGWLECADFALDMPDSSNLNTARLCYSAAIKADPMNVLARLGKAMVCHQQGHLAAAIADYNVVLQHTPRDITVVRKLAEACAGYRDAEATVPAAIAAYRQLFTAEGEDSESASSRFLPLDLEWQDVRIFAELFVCVGQIRTAIKELKSLARLMVGRGRDVLWEDWELDDREWDMEDQRRLTVQGFDPMEFDLATYGSALPLDIRARLAVYRLRMGDDAEFKEHMLWIDPVLEIGTNFVDEFPFLVRDIADQLFERGQFEGARSYYGLTGKIPGQMDVVALFQLGRCHVALQDPEAAEDCFLAMLELDESNVEARFELVQLYENALEVEEAVILSAEAMVLQQAHDPTGYGSSDVQNNVVRRNRLFNARTVVPSRYRPRRLVDPAKRRLDEQRRATRLAEQFQTARQLRMRIRAGESDLMATWMSIAMELIDSFRSVRQFYSWENYLQSIGTSESLAHDRQALGGLTLTEMIERLPKDSNSKTVEGNCFGIIFSDWLTLFLDYAISLALESRREDAYAVCEAAKNCVVFNTDQSQMFVHVTWAACALITADEEQCVRVSRHFMRDMESGSDGPRMFALLCRLCQSPITWYSCGRSQKFLLRQIKAMDSALKKTREDDGTAHEAGLDVCILMLYGHILFSSASFTFALNYFLRALALDPLNALVNFSVGLGFLHASLKRQAENRLYQILQGLAFLHQYLDIQLNQGSQTDVLTARFDVGRALDLLGLRDLAREFYDAAIAPPSPGLSLGPATQDDGYAAADVRLSAGYNKFQACLLRDDLDAASALVEEFLIL